jgi:hypothetical protein
MNCVNANHFHIVALMGYFRDLIANEGLPKVAAVIHDDRIEAAVGQGRLGPASAVAAHHDPMTTRRFLEILRAPAAGCIELRILRAVCDRRGSILRGDESGAGFGGSTLAGWYDDVELLVAQSRRLRGVSGYVTINPVRTDLLARSDNRLARARHTTRDADIACLRWLYLDIDPVRPPDISSTETELAAALARRDAILADHPELAALALWGRSGNGGWVLVRLPDYPNDPHHRGLVAEAVGTIARGYSDAAVVIDTATVNPARLIGLPGTLKAKGCHRPERPWRMVTLDGVGPAADPRRLGR